MKPSITAEIKASFVISGSSALAQEDLDDIAAAIETLIPAILHEQGFIDTAMKAVSATTIPSLDVEADS